MLENAVLILGSYLVGSTPHLSLLASLRNIDLDGDFHQNLWYRGGKTLGVIGVLGEFAKGVIPVFVGKGLGVPLAVTAFAGLAAVCGQMWPVFSRFDGEKGNSIAIAMVIALAPKPALVALVPVLVAIAIRTINRLTSKSGSYDKSIIGGSYSRSLPLGMAIYFFILPFTAWYFGESAGVIWCLVILFVLIMVRRLTAGIKQDFRVSKDVFGIITRRLLFDRSTASWRQQIT